MPVTVIRDLQIKNDSAGIVVAAARVGIADAGNDFAATTAEGAFDELKADIAALRSVVDYVNVPDAAPATTLVAGDAQGLVLHSGASNETAIKLFVDAETAPGASGLPVTWQYGDTDDLDTVASWTTIATLTLSSEKSTSTTTMTNATIPAARLMRTNYGTIVGSPKDVTTSLEAKRPLTT